MSCFAWDAVEGSVYHLLSNMETYLTHTVKMNVVQMDIVSVLHLVGCLIYILLV